ncbi:helicase associated domain-containing protein [Sinomonas terrae]|uniref:Helicase associated domain-containing protein n=1 Tax=Sinomonas terrae TaxID=2908838 RepID=A0ABS9U564_9MICC|nr:helicase associated domain-containing protein [Sinomonas terrae]MCH6471800.1 helicase associated domain-containing protein [Sinomonas terrae]HKU10889.1 helicase associated domain-containing protein [Sinomonas sp.]
MRQRLAREITGLPEPKEPEDQFARILRALADFRERHGRVPEKKAEETSESWLGAWLEAQRAEERSGALPEARSRMLKDVLGSDWA